MDIHSIVEATLGGGKNVSPAPVIVPPVAGPVIVPPVIVPPVIVAPVPPSAAQADINHAFSRPAVDFKTGMFRGIGVDVTGCKTPAETLQKAGMNWSAASADGIYAQLPDGTVIKDPGMRMVYRSDTRQPLSIMSTSYEPTQPVTLIEQFFEFAEAGDLRIVAAGALRGGRTMFAVADTVGTRGEFELRNKESQNRRFNDHSGRMADGLDKTVLQFVLSTSHDGTQRLRGRAMAWRAWCANGAFYCEKGAGFSMGHRTKFSNVQREAIRAMVEESFASFETYANRCRRMANTPLNRNANEALVVELLQSDLLQKLFAEDPNWRRKIPAGAEFSQRDCGSLVIEHLMNGGASPWEDKDLSRSVRAIMEYTDRQPHASDTAGTVWHAYNGLTGYVDHIRGRSAETGVHAALFGEGARVKESALDLCVAVTERLTGTIN